MGPNFQATSGSNMSDAAAAEARRARCDAPTDIDAVARGDVDRARDDGSKTVHVDCQRCRSRLEVRVPAALLAEGSTTVRCGACGVHLKVAVPPGLAPVHPPRPTFPAMTKPAERLPAASTPHPTQQRPATGASLQLSAGALASFLDPAVCVAMGANPTDPQLRRAAEEFWRSCDGDASAVDPNATYDTDLAPARPAKRAKKTRKPRDPSPYNVFIREEIPRLKAENPAMTHKDAFKAAAKNWAGSSLNMRSAAYVPDPVLAAAAAASAHANLDGGSNVTDAATRAAILQKLKPHLLRGRVEDARAEAAAARRWEMDLMTTNGVDGPTDAKGVDPYDGDAFACVNEGRDEPTHRGPVRPKTSWSSYRSTHEAFEPID